MHGKHLNPHFNGCAQGRSSRSNFQCALTCTSVRLSASLFSSPLTVRSAPALKQGRPLLAMILTMSTMRSECLRQARKPWMTSTWVGRVGGRKGRGRKGREWEQSARSNGSNPIRNKVNFSRNKGVGEENIIGVTCSHGFGLKFHWPSKV